ncbi:toll-like receptor 2 [Boleophthalmus pectinirostris]|uniref:toll-like receptor 2 n=1 Tax=Boleophthalmus pectinirostris TaxID=150288 RepID=UPI000A1C3899|nr:toll-like receptor 2 [Boleophthalmus pectinirostris]
MRAHRVSVWFSLVALVLLGSGFGSELDPTGLKLCVTSNSRIQNLCGQNRSAVPSNLPGDTEYLDLSHNAIRELTDDAFSGLHRLCFLKMSDCGLTGISPHVFEKTPSLKVLNVSLNKLSVVPDLSLRNVQILDLSYNVYKSYRLPNSYRNFKNLDVFALGSANATSVRFDDFDALQNVTLRHLVLGAGTKWLTYESGALAKLQLLQKFSLKVTFCGNFELLDSILEDLNRTRATALRFVAVFPDTCNVSGNPFEKIQKMPQIRNLSVEDTRTNTSFLEQFIKDVLESMVQELSLLNIAYDEDTPGGFRLPNLTHTAQIQSITISKITHMQYEYPKFEINFDLILKLTYLKFSGTGMNILPCNIFSAIPNLETLDVSDNLLDDKGFWWPSCLQEKVVFPKLKQLSLSKNRFYSLSFIAEKTHHIKHLESLDLSFNSIVLDGVVDWPFWLKELNLASNNLGDSVFNFLSPHFERIDLSKTGLTVLTQKDVSKFPNMTHLILSSNSIQSIPANLRAPSLLSLYVDQNAITSVFEEDLAGLPQLQTLRAGNNPFVCSCDSFWFITSLNKSLLPDWPLQYTCSTPPSHSGKPLTSVQGLTALNCQTWRQGLLGLAVIFSIVVIIGFLFHRLDGVWYGKMLWVWIQSKRRDHRRSENLRSALFSYHAFVSYSHRDAEWVESQLVERLEGAGLTLCVHERDFVPGEWVLDNIVKCVESSYKTLFVLSKHFVQSQWCNYELFFTQHRSIAAQHDSMVFVLLEPIAVDSLPKRYRRLRSVLRHRTYLAWPGEGHRRQVFWASLKSMLRGGNAFMVLKDVALSITETTPLINAEEEPEEHEDSESDAF